MSLASLWGSSLECQKGSRSVAKRNNHHLEGFKWCHDVVQLSIVSVLVSKPKQLPISVVGVDVGKSLMA